jgi:hypothetical protein
VTAYLGATGAREVIGWLTGGAPADRIDVGAAGPGFRTLTLRRPGAGARVLDRHALDYAPHERVTVGPAVAAFPADSLVLTNSAGLADALPVPSTATVVVAGEHGVVAGRDGRRLGEDEFDELVRGTGARHLRVLVDGGDPALATGAWSPALRSVLHLHEATFLAVRACAGRLDAGASVLVTVLDGVTDGTPRPFTGLFGGFVKSLALEYPDTPIAASMHERGDARAAVELAAGELSARHLLPVVLHSGGRRLTLRAVTEPAVPGDVPPLSRDSLVVAAGGARGIGAPILAALARRYRPRLVILGSTDLDGYTAADLAVRNEDRAAFIRGLVTGPDRVPVARANARFDRLQEARTIRDNLAELERHCGRGRVTYRRCDLRDTGAVRAVLGDVLAGLPGDVDLLLNIAGTNRASDVATKSRRDFLAVRDLKVHTYLNLKAALAGRPPRRWCNFGSFVGFTGQVGETDYASANDFLYSAAQSAGGGEFTMGWTLWRDIGLGATPVMRAFLAKSNQYSATPTDEGVAHFLAEVADPRARHATVFFGDKERAAITAAVPEYLAFCRAGHAGRAAPAEPAAPAAPARRLPFIDRIERGDGELTAFRRFDLDRDGYLRMHEVHGYPTLPGTFVPELAAEAAVALVPDRVPVVLQDLRLESFLRVYRPDRPETKKIHARLVSADANESVVEVQVLGDVTAPNGTVLAADRLHFAVTVRMRYRPVPGPRWTHWDDDGAERLADPYHADGSLVRLREVFESTTDTRMHPLGRRAALDLDRAAVHRWFPDLLLPSVLLDGLVRVAVLDRVEGRWTPVAIPRHVRRIDLYGPHTDASLSAAGAPVELYVTPADLDLEAERPDNRALAVTADGEVILQVKDIVGAIVGYLDQRTGRFVDRRRFDAGIRD